MNQPAMPVPRIIDVSFFPRELLLTSPFGIATGRLDVARNVFVKVSAQAGSQTVVGWGEAAPFPAVNNETSEQVCGELAACAPALVSKSLFESPAIAPTLSLCGSARAGLEMALLDALCRFAKLPLWAWFGGNQNRVESDFTLTTLDQDIGNKARSLAQRGYNVLKVKVGEPVDAYVASLKMISEVCPGHTVLLDGNAGLAGLDSALRLLAAAKGLGLQVTGFEQPFHKDAWDLHRMLQQQTTVPVILDESISDEQSISRAHALRAAQGVNLKLQKTGVFATRRMAEHAHALGLSLMMGAMVESVLGLSVAAALVKGSVPFKWIDLDTNHWLAQDPTQHQHDFSNAVIRLSEGHVGHGVIVPG